MNNITFGQLLEKNRENKKIPKTALCRGLCTVTALSRYEKDFRTPNKFLAITLLERLGLCPYKYDFLTSEEEFTLSMLRKNIEELISCHDTKQALSMISEYEKTLVKKDNLHTQYILFQKALIVFQEKNFEDSIPLLEDALSCTDCKPINEYQNSIVLFSNIEIHLYYYLAECLYSLTHYKEAYEIYHELKTYMEHIECSNTQIYSYYPHILYRLAQNEAANHNLGVAYDYLVTAESHIKSEYKINYLHDILKLKSEIEQSMEMKESSIDAQNFLLALEIISSSENGLITEKGIALWENTVKQQL